MKWIGDQNGPNRGASDNHQLRRLDKHLQIAVLHQIPSKHCPEDHDDSNNREHRDPFLLKMHGRYMRTLMPFPLADAPPRSAASARLTIESTVSPAAGEVPPNEAVTETLSPHQLISV